ncbi:MAG: ribonuclease D [Gammaproteobacteria bacterium]|nr:MAG: ribonuclease D [Gammaproteobacteria bacterium]TND04419.1 MAG: ribonuclease D [Gammaproteobacteria bacterium]
MAYKNSSEYIATPEQLAAACRRISTCAWLAIDTEFIREKTYFPQLCLIQVGTPEAVFCIDPLALASLGPLLEVFYDTRITKVFHAARQDLEIFYHLTGDLPRPVFDTQLAAMLLGYPDQAGYATLVTEVLGVTLDKAYSRTDWARRPLPDDQLQYAADDVRYLVPLYQHLHRELAARGRLAWLDDDFAKLTDTATYRNEPADAWQRIRGADRLQPKSLAVLEALAAWRETAAVVQDRPRGWILRDEVLIDLARLMPGSMAELEQIRGLRRENLQRDSNTLLDLIRSAKSRAAPATPVAAAARLTADQQALADVLMAVVRLRGARESLSPATLASRKDIEQLLLDSGESRVLQGWRKSVVGNELLAFLHGERRLRFADGALQLDVSTDP